MHRCENGRQDRIFQEHGAPILESRQHDGAWGCYRVGVEEGVRRVRIVGRLQRFGVYSCSNSYSSFSHRVCSSGRCTSTGAKQKEARGSVGGDLGNDFHDRGAERFPHGA